MTKLITDPSPSATSLSVAPTNLGTTTGDSTLLLGTPGSTMGSSASSSGQAGGGERVQKIADMLHRTIDSIERQLQPKSQSLMSAQGKYGEQARQYGETLRSRVTTQPLQSVGIAALAGVVMAKLFLRSSPKVRVVKVPEVRVVKVPVPVSSPMPAARTPMWGSSPATERRAEGWMYAAGSRLQAMKEAAQQAAAKAGATAGMGLAGTKAMAERSTDKASTLPLQMRLAAERMMAKSQAYGSMARTGVQAHPVYGGGAVLALVGLVTTLWLKRRQAPSNAAYVTVDERGNGLAWQHDRPSMQTRTVDMVSQRPVASAAVMVGIGALVSAMLRRR